MNKRKQSFQDFLVSQFGESILEPLYQRLGFAGALVVLAKLVAAGITFATDVDFPEVVTGPIWWQLFVALLLVVSHAQPNEATLDRNSARGRYWMALTVETMALTACLVCVGLLVFYAEALFPFTFWGLSLMILSIMVRRLLTDSIKPSIQILRFSTACWFLMVGTWMQLFGNEMNSKIGAISWALLTCYFVLIYRRRPTVSSD